WLMAFRGIRRLKDPGALRPWLYPIAHGVPVDLIRRSVARERAEEGHLDGLSDTVEPTFSAGDGAAIHRALDELEAAHREVLVLHFLEDFTGGRHRRHREVPARHGEVTAVSCQARDA